MFEGSQHLLTVRDWMRYAVTLFTRERVAFGQGSARAWDEDTPAPIPTRLAMATP